MIFLSKARFRAACCGRRFGKTHLAIVTALLKALEAPGRVIWFVAPSYRQAEQIAWKILLRLIPPGNLAKKDETDLRVELRNDSVIALRGADNFDSLRGVGLDGLILDEYADMASKAWFEVLRPALSDRQGWALFIGTPKGFNHFHTLWTQAHILDGWEAFQFTTLDGGRVPAEEIETARAELDPRTFRQEYEASFESMAGLVYCNFNRKVHIQEDLKDTGGTLLVGLDFNINPMSAVVGVRSGDQLHVLDEISLTNSNTQRMADEVKRRYPNRQISVYPDPSGNARKTSAGIGQTDFAILRQAGFRVIAPPKAPSVTDRVNEVNALFENAKQEHRLFIHKRCQKLIHCLEGLTYREGTDEPDKRLGLD
ncbi:MAG TPA: terminase family protein, partial [Holophaga sp.]|nr:terminase family protein [Holophaga sp.]